jgi:ring-1,2-phenylacetyl-CoA epoxidase subunit PaaC
MTAHEPGLAAATDETRAAFRRLILSLADSKRILGIRYSDWLLGAPSIEAGIAASSMAQDEWGHARLLYATLKDFGEDPVRIEHDRPAEAYTSIEALDHPLEDWAVVSAVMLLVDGALSTALEGVLEGGYSSIAGRVGKMLGEEEFHESLAGAWAGRLSEAEGEGKARFRSAVEAILPATLRFLAPDDEAHRALVAAGLTLPADELRRRFARKVGDVLEQLGLSIESAGAPAGDWDPVRGRGAGHPDEEAVECARGDLNRALFVE